MGAITRAAANNITTGGVILPAGINDASVASISSLAQISVGDGITLISSQTASSSASISFTGIDSTYRSYFFKYINIHPSSDSARFNFNLSSDGGSNYNVVKTTTGFRAVHAEDDSFYQFSYVGLDVEQSTADTPLLDGVGADSDQSASGFLYLYNPSSTTYVKHYVARSSSVRGDDYSFDVLCSGYANTTSACDAVIFKFSTGNIDAGTIYMYGVA